MVLSLVEIGRHTDVDVAVVEVGAERLGDCLDYSGRAYYQPYRLIGSNQRKRCPLASSLWRIMELYVRHTFPPSLLEWMYKVRVVRRLLVIRRRDSTGGS